MGCKKLQFVCSAALLNAVTVGICSTYSSTATESMKSSILNPSNTEVSWIGSIFPLGAIVGGLLAGYLSDKIGRKSVMIYLSVPLLIGWLLIAYATSLSYVYAGRFITGICCGCICVVTPMYIVEISTAQDRGNLGCRFQMFICAGIIIVSALGRYLTWNWVAACAAVFTVLTPIFLLFLPESPRWLLMHGKQLETVRAMRFLHGEAADLLTAQLLEENQDKQTGKLSNIHEILQPVIYKPIFLSIALMFFQQFSGSNAILYYTVHIFKEAKSSIDPSLSNIIVAFFMFNFTLASCYLMDVFGRKKSLIISGSLMCVFLSGLSTYLYISRLNPSLKETLGWIPLLCLLMYISAFSLGLGPVPWLMMSELSPTHARGLICGLGTAFSWIFAFIITNSFITIEDTIDDFGAYWFYSFFCLACCLFTVLFLPETKGKSFEEIQAHFLKRNVPLQRLEEDTNDGLSGIISF